jgi:glycosyltransferase involved in cell wall biosynthesis
MKLSLVIPVYNEEENLELLFQSILSTLKPMSIDWELVFVDDGSTDSSIRVLSRIAEKNRHRVKIIVLQRNYGQTAAIAAGIDHTTGDTVILMDADMQNDPADIPMMLKKLDEGFDVVSGWRKNRQDDFLSRKIPSLLANGMISRVTGVHLHDYGCTLKAYRKEILTQFRLYGEMHRFIPVYAHAAGARITEIVVHHHARKFGKTKYGLERIFKVLLDLFTVKFLMSYSAKPIYLFGGIGIGLICASILTLLFLAIRRIFLSISVLNSPFFQMSIVILVLGFQSILMGLIAELLMRTYHETQGKSTYIVRQVINGSKIHKA